MWLDRTNPKGLWQVVSSTISEGNFFYLYKSGFLNKLSTVYLTGYSVCLGNVIRDFAFASQELLKELLHSLFIETSFHEIWESMCLYLVHLRVYYLSLSVREAYELFFYYLFHTLQAITLQLVSNQLTIQHLLWPSWILLCLLLITLAKLWSS